MDKEKDESTSIEKDIQKLKRQVSWLQILVNALIGCVIILAFRNNQIADSVDLLVDNVSTIWNSIGSITNGFTTLRDKRPPKIPCKRQTRTV